MMDFRSSEEVIAIIMAACFFAFIVGAICFTIWLFGCP